VITEARAVALEVVRETFEDGAFTERAFRAAADANGLSGRERAQSQRLAYGAVQRRATTDAAIARLSSRPPQRLDPPVLAALRLGLYELLFGDSTPDHAAVDQAVESVRAAGAAHATGLVNAVLRRAARERAELSSDLLGDDSTPERAAVAHSAPLWLARMWWEELGPADARSLLAACNEPAEVALRVNKKFAPRSQRNESDMDARSLGAQIETVVSDLHAEGVEVASAAGEWPLAAPELLVLDGRMGEGAQARIGSGELTPQSRGSAGVVEALDPQPGEHVLDLCAGPGIKTGQIAARVGDRGEAFSVEIDPERAAEVAAQAGRLGLRNVSVIETDAAAGGLPAQFDRVLVDAPCSDLGALASRPDARWRKSERGIDRMTEIQSRILVRAAEALRPGGTLVYATCTISRRENEDRVAALLDACSRGDAPPLALEDLGALASALASSHDPRCLQVRPDRDRTTGFFISRLRRDD
jgi:16S rRNA (cytosine967-C5)-methyltransferase